MKKLQMTTRNGYSAVYTLQVFTHRHVCRCSPCFRFYVLHIPFIHVSTFFMKHPQCTYAPTMQQASCYPLAAQAPKCSVVWC
jgi:hypothetical protein